MHVCLQDQNVRKVYPPSTLVFYASLVKHRSLFLVKQDNALAAEPLRRGLECQRTGTCWAPFLIFLVEIIATPIPKAPFAR